MTAQDNNNKTAEEEGQSGLASPSGLAARAPGLHLDSVLCGAGEPPLGLVLRNSCSPPPVCLPIHRVLTRHNGVSCLSDQAQR